MPTRTYNQIKCQYHNRMKKQALEQCGCTRIVKAVQRQPPPQQPAPRPQTLVNDVVNMLIDTSLERMKKEKQEGEPPKEEAEQQEQTNQGTDHLHGLEDALNKLYK